MTASKKPVSKQVDKKPAPKRVEIFTKKYCDSNGIMHNVGDPCELTGDELVRLTELNLIKMVVKKEG